MFEYAILLSILGYVSFLKRSFQKNFYPFLFLLLILLSGLRSDMVGTDTGGYLRTFQYFDIHFLENSAKDFGFYYLMGLVRSFTDNKTIFLFVTSLFTLIPLFYFIKKTSLNVPFSLFLYVVLGFYTQSFNVIRQSIAISFILLAVYYLSNRSLTKSVISFFIATQFHLSALLVGVIYIINHIKFSFRTVSIATTISAILGILLAKNPQALNNLISLFGMDSYFGISKYVYIVDRQNLYLNLLGILPGILSFSTLLLLSYRNIKEDLILKLFFVGVVINNLVCFHDVLLRFPYYFTILSIIIVPRLMEQIKTKINTAILFYILVLLTLFFFYSGYHIMEASLSTRQSASFPYNFFFE